MSTEMHDSAQRSLRGGKVFFVINVVFTIEVTFRQDKTYGKIHQAVPKHLKKIKVELMNNGPVEATFKVIRDFLHYKTGVYQHIAVEQIQGHAFRLLGWNYDWGDAGTFKILRGSDHLGIEGWITAGMPKLDNDPMDNSTPQPRVTNDNEITVAAGGIKSSHRPLVQYQYHRGLAMGPSRQPSYDRSSIISARRVSFILIGWK